MAKRSLYKYSNDNTEQVKEAYKTIRTNLQYALAGDEKKIVAVSSSVPSEGKSTTAANLAFTISQTGSSVLLVDADLRHPTINKLFKLVNNDGLSKILSKQSTVEDAIHRDVRENLSVITAGPIPPNPSELLATPAIVDLLEEMDKEFDYIIIDTPPINVVSDCQIIVRAVTGVIFVARYKFSRYGEIEHATESIRNVGGSILGVVLNDINEKGKSYYTGKYYKRYYKNYYRSYYDYDSSNES